MANKEWHNEWLRTGTIGEDALIQWFQRLSLLPCLTLPVVVKSWKCNAATANKGSSLTGTQHAAWGADVEATLFFALSHTSFHLPVCQHMFYAITDFYRGLSLPHTQVNATQTSNSFPCENNQQIRDTGCAGGDNAVKYWHQNASDVIYGTQQLAE